MIILVAILSSKKNCELLLFSAVQFLYTVPIVDRNGQVLQHGPLFNFNLLGDRNLSVRVGETFESYCEK